MGAKRWGQNDGDKKMVIKNGDKTIEIKRSRETDAHKNIDITR